MTNDSVCPECGSRDVYSRASEYMCGSCGRRFSIGASFQYDVFISYRGDGTGNLFANRLADDLENVGYSVYFNSKERRSGRFDERIGDAIAGCTDFIPIVTKGYLDRLYSTSENDTNWVREELRMAMRNRDTVRITPKRFPPMFMAAGTRCSPSLA